MLRRPNNNLALAYVKRIRQKNYNMSPYAIERVGADFHETDLSGAPSGEAYASAAAIRALARDERDEAYSLMPDECALILRRALREGRTAKDRDRLWRAVKQAIIRAGADGLREVSEMGEGLEYRMLDLAYRSASFDSFVDSCASRRYTKGRIQRHAMHLLISLSHERSRGFQSRGPAYIRALGANRAGRELLAAMRKTASLPVISKASAPWDEYAKNMMNSEHLATEIWETLTDNPRARREAMLVPIMRDEC
jgi:predicted nucleotidyltransferase